MLNYSEGKSFQNQQKHKMNQEEIINKRIEMLKELEQISIEKGMSLKDVSEKSGLIESNISRLFSGKFSPSVDNFLKIKKAITGKL